MYFLWKTASLGLDLRLLDISKNKIARRSLAVVMVLPTTALTITLNLFLYIGLFLLVTARTVINLFKNPIWKSKYWNEYEEKRND